MKRTEKKTNHLGHLFGIVSERFLPNGVSPRASFISALEGENSGRLSSPWSSSSTLSSRESAGVVLGEWVMDDVDPGSEDDDSSSEPGMASKSDDSDDEDDDGRDAVPMRAEMSTREMAKKKAMRMCLAARFRAGSESSKSCRMELNSSAPGAWYPGRRSICWLLIESDDCQRWIDLLLLSRELLLG